MNTDLNRIVQAVDRLTAAQHKGAWDHASTVAVVLTLVVLIWYTYETYRLRKAAQDQTAETGRLLKEAQRQNEVSSSLLTTAQGQNEVTANLLKEAQRQNELSVMPMLAVINEEPHGQKRRSNVGSGPAFNLSIDRVQWDNQEIKIEYGNNIMTPGQRKDLWFHHSKQSSGTTLDVSTLYLWINTERIPDPLSLVVRCRSVNSVQYAFTFNCTADADGTGQLKIKFEGHEQTAPDR